MIAITWLKSKFSINFSERFLAFNKSILPQLSGQFHTIPLMEYTGPRMVQLLQKDTHALTHTHTHTLQLLLLPPHN